MIGMALWATAITALGALALALRVRMRREPARI
jgi:hypothetical protein